MNGSWFLALGAGGLVFAGSLALLCHFSLGALA